MQFRILLLSSLFLLLSCEKTKDGEITAPIDSTDLFIWPPPQNISEKDRKVDLERGIYISPALSTDSRISSQLKSFVDDLGNLGISSSDPKGLELNVVSYIGEQKIDKQEAYNLDFQKSGATLSFWDYEGLRYGLHTLSQILHKSTISPVLPEIKISDHPKLDTRAVFLDVVSHWFPLEVLFETVDQMATARFNKLYLHISDDQAYRIQSVLFEKLNKQHSSGEQDSFADIKKLLEYAMQRGIEVIPSIDVPGHVGALVSAYPELGLSDRSGRYEGYGIQKAIINPAAKNTIPFLKNLIQEITTAFDADEIHLGGAEVRYDLWMDNAEILSFIEKAELTHPQQLHGLFTIQLHQIMKELDKTMTIWDAAYRPEIKDPNHIQYMSVGDHVSSFGIANEGFDVISGVGWSLDRQRHASKLYQQSPYESHVYFDAQPDSSAYLRFDLSGSLAEQQIPSILVIYGEDPSYITGYVSVSRKVYPFEGAKLKDTRLEIRTENTKDVFEAAFDLSDAKAISGIISLSGFSLQVTGKKTGGSDMDDGLPLPPIPETPKLHNTNNITGGVAIVRTPWLDQNNIVLKTASSLDAIGGSMWNRSGLNAADFTHFFSTYQAYRAASLDTPSPLRRYVDDSPEGSSLHSFLTLLEEISEAKRFADNPTHNSSSALNGFVDFVASESFESSQFSALVHTVINEGSEADLLDEIKSKLDLWIPTYRTIKSTLQQNSDLTELEVLALSLSDLAKIARHVMDSGTLTAEESEYYKKLSANAQREILGIRLGPAKPLIKLIDSYRDAL